MKNHRPIYVYTYTPVCTRQSSAIDSPTSLGTKMSSNLDRDWITHLRKASRQDKGKGKAKGLTQDKVRCPACEVEVIDDLQDFKNHVIADGAKHQSLGEGETAIEDAFNKITLKTSFVSLNMPLLTSWES